MFPRQYYFSIILGVLILILIIRLLQKSELDIAYCWLWLGIGISIVTVVVKYDWLEIISETIGSKTPTTTLFLFGILILFLMCLQFSLVISAHRRQIKILSQKLAILTASSDIKTK